MPAPELVVDYAQRPQFIPFHRRCQRFACIVTHRRAGKTVACIHDLQLGATQSNKIRPRFAYLSPFLKQSKAVAWDYLRAAMAPLRAINPDVLRGIYLDGVVLDEFADMDPRVWSEIIRPALADRQGWAVFIGTPKGRNAFFELWRARSRNRIGFPSCSRQAIPASFPQASSRSPGAISARTNTRRSSNAPSTPRSSVPTTAS
jgi:phage terminase large subunit